MVFREIGYSDTSLVQIAARAGVARQAIYRRYESKETLFLSVLMRRHEKLMAIPIARGRGIEGLKEHCRILLQFILEPEHIDLQRIVISESSRIPGLSDRIGQVYLGDTSARGAGFVAEAQAKGELSAGRAETIAGRIHWAVIGWPYIASLMNLGWEAPDGDLDSYVDATVDALIAGLGPEGNPNRA